MKRLTLFCSLLIIILLLGCDKDLKEHPLPESLKKELARKADPTIHNNDVFGTISIDPGLKVGLNPSAGLFIFARPEGVDAGPPLAVKRHSVFQFPFEFDIGQLNTMMEGSQFEGAMNLTARLDQDGNRKSSPGDVEGKIQITAGQKGVQLVLNNLISGDAYNIEGTVNVSEALQKKIPENGTLFIFARSEGVKRGPPLAVKRVAELKLPYEFTLGPQDVMMQGTAFEGPMVLAARIDVDGDARAGPGDIEGFVSAQPGDRNIKLLLNHLTGPAAGGN
ncbi:MAG: c-type cytochrome biogenesis protein CcmI/CycH [Nitrospinaceae bacterium]